MCSIIGLTSKELTAQSVREYFDRTVSRGPDATRMAELDGAVLGFHRLSIMGLDERGMQPFYLGGDAVVCNGELYGFRQLRKELSAKYSFKSESDCEIILPLYREYGLEMFKKLDAEFAMIKRAFCTEIYSKSTIPVRHGWSRTSGCRTKRGRAVTLTTPPHEFLKTTARAENKRRIKP